MKLYGDTAEVNEIWEGDKENKKQDYKVSSNITQKRSKSAVMYESGFYNRSKLESTKKNTFSSLKAKLKVTPSFSKLYVSKQSAQQPCSSENENRDATFVNKCKDVEIINGVDSNSNFDYTEKVSPGITMAKPILHRGKSDACLNLTSRRRTEYGMDINCRTEYTIPGEFLFCSKVEHSNNFALVYDQIKSGGNLRRSQSTGSIGRQRKSNGTKDDFQLEGVTVHRSTRTKEVTDVATRSSCEKLYVHEYNEYDEREQSQKDSKFLADELQSILDNNENSLDLKRNNSLTSQHGKQKETSFIENIRDYDIDQNIGDTASPKVSEQVKGNRRPSASRSQSCKSVQRRLSNIFSISKYLKDRNTQRSKSFATIREFSNHDVNYRKNARNVSRNENVRYNDTTLDVSDEYYNTDIQLGQTCRSSKDIELSPIKTTKNFDINHTDSHGNSCLHHASSKGDISTIKYLLEQGGDVWVKNDEHHLPIDLAQNFQTAKLLSSATLFYSEQNEPRKERNIVETSKLNTAL